MYIFKSPLSLIMAKIYIIGVNNYQFTAFNLIKKLQEKCTILTRTGR